MADTATRRGRAQKIEQYTKDNAWGPELNDGGLERMDEMWAVKAVTVNGNVTLTAQNFIQDEARSAVLILSGAGGFAVTAPAVDKPYLVVNNCAADVTVKPSGGTQATVRAGTAVWYYTNADADTGFVVDPTLDKIKAPAAHVSLNSKKITGLADPTDAQDAATKNYIDTLAAAGDLATVAGIADEIVVLADIQDGTVATDAITDVAEVADEVALLGPIHEDISQLAGMFVGASATDPATRLDGSPLQAGDYYLNTSGTPTVQVYDGSNWIPIEAVTLASQPEAEAGVNNTNVMTPLRTKQAIDAQRALGSQTFTSSGTFNKPSGASYFFIECIGGGGGGANSASSSTNRAGGGGGAYVSDVFPSAALAASTPITVGASGAGGASGGSTSGSSGGFSTFGALVRASGGGGGTNAVSGQAGIGLVGADGISLFAGAGATDVSAVGQNTIAGGAGGGASGINTGGGTSERHGAGGTGNNTLNVKGGNGIAPGGGGGGSGNNGGGGDGARGEVRVHWW